MQYFEKNTKKVYINTLFLYGRMFFLMFITLYTSRLTLKYLGITDFGIYNVVAGIISVLSFLSNSMALSVNRFLSYAMGRNDKSGLKEVFSLSVIIHVFIALIVLLAGETVGFWFVNHKLVIPEDRMLAANVIYQFSIISFAFTVIRVPYNGAIIAHEDMKIYTYLGLVEGILRLLIVISLAFVLYDKLIIYGLLFASLTILVSLFYIFYCKRRYEECSVKKVSNRPLFREMLSYAGISTMGNLSTVVLDQGQNILLNIFFGPAVNAARGISYQVNTAVSAFVSNIYAAATPQITKSFAAEDKEYLHKIVNETTALAMVILLAINIPVITNLPYLLQLWLGENVPHLTAEFCQLILIGLLLSNCCRPLLIAIQSSGDIWRVHLYTSLVIIINIPVDYFLLKYAGMYASGVFLIYIISLFFFVAVVLYLSKVQLGWDIRLYVLKILIPVFLVFLVSSVVVKITHSYVSSDLLALISDCFCSTVVVLLLSYYIILPKSLKEGVIRIIRRKISSIRKS